MSLPVLHIGNKTYSSWSMRPWLALKWAGLPFEERVTPLAMGGYGKSRSAEIRAASPSGRLPVLWAGGVAIWDSLAICEFAAEQPGAELLPADPLARAVCRSACAEMHAGFAALRRELPMNTRRMAGGSRLLSNDATADLARVTELWSDLRGRFGKGGPLLFGRRTIADAMFAPVASRIRTYAAAVAAPALAYVEALLDDPAVVAWYAEAAQEPWALPEIDTH